MGCRHEYAQLTETCRASKALSEQSSFALAHLTYKFAEKPAHPLMRGQQKRIGSLFSYVLIEDRIPASHPLRLIRKLADQALDRINPTFCRLYASEGGPSVPPAQLLLASLGQAFFGIRSECLRLEQLDQNLLFRWFVRLSPDDPIWHHLHQELPLAAQ